MDKFNLFLDEWHIELKLLQNDSNADKKSKLFDDLAYKKMERSKSMFIFKIYESLAIININSDNIITFGNEIDFKFNYFDKKILKSEDKFYQKFILIILVLFILKIISFKLTIVIALF